MQDRSKKVKLLALQGLVDIKNPRAVGPLIISLKDSDNACKRLGISGLIQLDTYAVPSLIDAMNGGTESDTIDIQFKIDIINTLGEIQDSRAIEPLLKISNASKSTLVKEATQEAIKKIELYNENMKQKLNLYCLNCYSNFIKNKQPILHFLNSSLVPVCRNCKSNKNYLENVKKVVLFLDDMEDSYRFENGILNVNWFRVKRSIDMQEIAIIKGTNEDIAELVMKLKNDDDSERKKMYKHVPILIAKNLNISQAKINLLQNTFGNVHVVEKDTINRLGE